MLTATSYGADAATFRLNFRRQGLLWFFQSLTVGYTLARQRATSLSATTAVRVTSRLGVSACAWVVCVRTHMRVVKMAAIARTVRTEKRSSSATKQFQRKSHIFSDLRRQLGM